MVLSRKKALKTLLGSFFALPVFASTPKVSRSAVAEFLESHKRSKKYTLAVFNQMPEDGMTFKPLPEMFTFQRHFVHCIEFVAGQLTARLSIKNPFDGIDLNKLSKEETKKALNDCYDWVEKTVATATPQQLAKTGDFSGDQVDLLRLLYICENHLIHHRGTTMVYLRMKNIVPEGYVGW
jgi:uncharacterized damage-inducible protein DinB